MATTLTAKKNPASQALSNIAAGVGKVGKAIGNGLSTLGASVTKVDNANDPTSRYSMNKREMDAAGKPKGFLSGNKAVPFRNSRQEALSSGISKKY